MVPEKDDLCVPIGTYVEQNRKLESNDNNGLSGEGSLYAHHSSTPITQSPPENRRLIQATESDSSPQASTHVSPQGDEPLSFRVGLNTQIIGKCHPNKASHKGAWQATSVTMVTLAKHISLGHPWMPGLLGGNGKRWAINVSSAAVMALDFDDGFTIEQALAHPFIAAHAGLVIESSSSTPELHKFRVVFRLASPIQGAAAVGTANKYLLSLFPEADQSCKDACRFFFGGLGREAQLLNELAVLPESFEANSQAWQAEQDRQWAERKAEQDRRWAALREPQSGDEQIELVKSALSAIPHRQAGDGRHDELVAMIGGLTNELGPEGERLLMAWDAGQGEWGRPFERFLQSITRKRGKAGLGTLFRMAKEAGWDRPKKERAATTKCVRSEDTHTLVTDAEAEAIALAQEQEADYQKVVNLFERKAWKAHREQKVKGFADVKKPQRKEANWEAENKANPHQAGAKTGTAGGTESQRVGAGVGQDLTLDRLIDIASARAVGEADDSVGGGNDSSGAGRSVGESVGGCSSTRHVDSSSGAGDSTDKAEVIEFSQGDRIATIQQAIDKGYRHVLDLSGTGSGKSTDAGHSQPESFEADRLWYLTSESRKPSTPEIEMNYQVLPVRNGGMFRDSTQLTPLGKAVIRHPKAGEKTDIAGNCIQPHLFPLFAALGIDVEGEGNPICMGCPKVHVCKAVDGWFKNDRQVALKQPRITAHPQSLNNPDSFEYGSDVAFWDEPGDLFQFRSEVEVSEADLNQTVGAIADDYPALHEQLKPISRTLRSLLNAEQTTRYGWGDQALAEALPQVEEDELALIKNGVVFYYAQRLKDTAFLEQYATVDTSEEAKAIASLRGKLTRRQSKFAPLTARLEAAQRAMKAYKSEGLFGAAPTAAQMNDAENLPSKVTALETEICDLQTALASAEGTLYGKQLHEQDQQTLERGQKHQDLQGLQKRWLSHFLRALAREKGYSFRLQNGRLTISYPISRYSDIAAAMKGNIYLDTTLTRKRLALMLGISESEICVIRQKGTGLEVPENLRVVQIADMGKVARGKRSGELTGRVAALTRHLQQEHPGLGVIDFKGADSKHYWFRDNRGSNEFKDSPALVTIGTPCPNIAALEADFIALTGDRNTQKGDLAWDAFVTNAIDNEFIQAAGRPRAQYRPQQQITYYVVSSHPLPAELRAELVAGKDICLEAAKPNVQTWERIKAFVDTQLSTQQVLPTQTEIAQALGVIQGQVSKLCKMFAGSWMSLKKIFQTLLETHIANGIFLELPESEQQQALHQTELLEAIAESPPDPGDDTPGFLTELLEAIGHRAFAIAASQMKPINRGRLLQKLLNAPDFEGWEAV